MQTAPDPTSFTTAIKHGYILIALSVTVLVISFAIHYIKYGSFDPLEMYYLPGSALILLLVLLDTQYYKCMAASAEAQRNGTDVKDFENVGEVLIAYFFGFGLHYVFAFNVVAIWLLHMYRRDFSIRWQYALSLWVGLKVLYDFRMFVWPLYAVYRWDIV